ncbi:MAG: cohesin domain-containing protein [Bacteroidetes bacterium]|nr:cohesin domain-containing protein [Bacteroidota bacterium]
MYLLKTSYLNKTNILRVTSLMMGMLFSSLFVNAQTPGLSIGRVGVCGNATVSVPITGTNLSNIGAIQLFINYDAQSLSFNSIENLNPQLNGLIFNSLPGSSSIAIVWSKTSGVSFMNATLLNLKFDVIKNSGTINFNKAQCEVAVLSIPLPEVIAIDYTDGATFEDIPVISSEPQNRTISSQSNAVFQVSSPNASGYIWQESRNDGSIWSNISETATYGGTQTNILTIRHVPVNFSNFMYRCVLNQSTCVSISSAALLKVDTLSGISRQSSAAMLALTNSPNPFSGKTTIEYSVPQNGYVTLKIFSMTGQLMETPVEKPHVAGTYRMEDNFVSLPAGIYFCQYAFKGPNGMYETYRKMIKLN